MRGKKPRNTPLVLLILDGFGISKSQEGNAIAKARTPNLDFLYKNHPWTTLQASGEAVGLPKNNQGTSEVGHLNIGAGRIVYQNLVRINKSIEDDSFFRIKEFLAAIRHCKKHNSSLHLLGLLQDQGVHAHQDHLFALLKLCRQQKFENVKIHVFSDGRDTLPKSCGKYLRKLMSAIRKYRLGKIATLSGRYYAMDRDNRWDRTKKAYDCIMNGDAPNTDNIDKALADAYKRGETDEFIIPTVIGDYKGVNELDAIIFYNFRYDRARQITAAFTQMNFSDFKRQAKKIFFVAMTNYYQGICAHVAFKEIEIKNNLGKVLSIHKISQLRIAETEKYAHVTYFFNSLRERPYPGEKRILVPSQRDVPTYDLKPEMSAHAITNGLLSNLKQRNSSVFIVNFANPDMVGHTGVLDAAIRAVEVVDECIGKIHHEVAAQDGTLIVTSDHGNCEKMIEKDGGANTAHTISKVPFIIASRQRYKLRHGILSDIAPTILDVLSIRKPKDMERESLIIQG